MNFLAHLFLSGENEKVKVGNFIGDFVKGNQLEKYEAEIQLGIKLHREIDHYTDSHPIVLESKKRLRPTFSHYSPVIVDVYYDHFLAKNWNKFMQVELKHYTTKFYQMIKGYSNVIPQAVNNMLVYMSETDWLYNYQFLEGIDRALTGMSRRTKFESKMEVAAKSLEEHYDLYENEFRIFFPQLQSHVTKILS